MTQNAQTPDLTITRKDAFAEKVSVALETGPKSDLVLHSFVSCEIPEPSKDRASVEQQEAFMISGKQNESIHFKDILDGSHSYRAEREIIRDIVDFIQVDNSVALIHGGICSGKTLVFEECILDLLRQGEQVFRLNAKYYDLLSEARMVLKAFPSCILAIDNCFSLRADLHEIVRTADSVGTKVLLATRTLAYDAEEDLQTVLQEKSAFKAFDTEILSANEGRTVIDCTDRIGGWGQLVTGQTQKLRILERDHSSRLSGFLLGIFKSPHIRKRFKSELDQLKTSGDSVISALIIALYLKSIGENVQESVLSELIGQDSVRLFKNADNAKSFITYRPGRKSFELLPSVNAREALKQFFDPADVTNAIIDSVCRLEDVRHQLAFKRVFTEMMRYTQLKQVVTDFDQQDRFFDRLSEMWFCKRHVLFWLQWSMAMGDHKEWPKSIQYLDEAYGRGKESPNFNSAHLDDQKAGLLLDSASPSAPSSEFLRRFKEVCALLARSISQGEVTSHNYQTIKSFDGFFEKAKRELIPAHKNLMRLVIEPLRAQVQKKYDDQHESFVKDTMERALTSIDDALIILNNP